MNERPVAAYAAQYGLSHNVLDNAIRDGCRGKPWGLRAQRSQFGNMYTVEQADFEAWYQRYQANRAKRKVKQS
jgi:hypothetical protein